MDAILMAGGIPEPGDLLYPYTLGQSKTFLEIAGKPMIQWVLNALGESKTIQSVVIVGLDPNQDVFCAKPLSFVPNQGSMLKNIRIGVKKSVDLNPQAEYALIVSSDIPAITGAMIDWSVNNSLQTEEDIYYNVIPRDVMEARYPGSNRSYIRLKDMEVCGGDMHMIHASVAIGRDEIWNRLIAARKNALKQAALIGYDTLILLLLKRLSLDDLVKTVMKRLDLRGRVFISPYAEIGMDVDKPHQLEIMRADLESRSKG